jgi:uncharacterized FAD-dependent dehydrogenase
MQQNISLRLLPNEVSNDAVIKEYIAQHLSVRNEHITGFSRLKQSIDARSKKIWISLTVKAFIDEPFVQRQVQKIVLKDVSRAKHNVIIIGAGPAGIFAALKLIEQGIKPIILERGKDTRARRRDLAVLNKEGIVNPESNYCFGEGGAGTYSDGKLYTRSTKRGNIDRILNIFVQFGADEKILYESHPHIGTNKLPHIITAMREDIMHCGGEVLFEKKVTDLIIRYEIVQSVETADGSSFNADAIILATGHSARDIFELLYYKKIFIEAKPFALGVRVEHPQILIDSIQYHKPPPASPKGRGLRRSEYLPPASYSLVEQVNDKAVFSFCMCPGGIIAPAATNPSELVVNGWSPSKRNNPFANSGMVVPVEVKDAFSYFKKLKSEMSFLTDSVAQGNLKFKNRTANIASQPSNALLLMHFQKEVEQKAYEAGGGKLVAPAQRMVDFCNNKISSTLPECSYLPGVQSADLKKVLPDFVYTALQKSFKTFGNKMTARYGGQGYFTNDAIVLATESRTSSPVRITRNEKTLHHVQIKNLYPCGEGAGYAGGIVSAAMDGERIAAAIADLLLH